MKRPALLMRMKMSHIMFIILFWHKILRQSAATNANLQQQSHDTPTVAKFSNLVRNMQVFTDEFQNKATDVKSPRAKLV
jgi:hypothetical protein